MGRRAIGWGAVGDGSQKALIGWKIGEAGK